MRKWLLFIPVILIIALLCSSCLGTTSPKETTLAPTETIPGLTARVTALETAVGKLGNAPTQAELGQVKSDLAVTNKSLSDIQAQLKTINDALPGLTTRLTSVETQLTSALARITVLEKAGTTTTTSTAPQDAVSVDYTSYTNPILAKGDTSFSYSLTIKLTNNLSVAIKNVEIIFSFIPYGVVIGYTVATDGSTKVIGGSVPWGLVTAGSPAQVVFVSGLLGAGSPTYIGGTQSFSLKANEVKSITLTATVSFSAMPTTGRVDINWYVNAYCNSYDKQ